MKKSLLFAGLCALLLACNGNDKPVIPTQNSDSFLYSDSSACAHVRLEGELPLPTDPVQTAIRTDLLSLVEDLYKNVTDLGEGTALATYSGDRSVMQNVATYYGEKIYTLLQQECLDELAEMERQDTICYEVLSTLNKTEETPLYVQYTEETYTYMGGAHGGMGGLGVLTYRLKDGQRISQFLKPGAQQALQPLLRAGLKDYFADPTMTDEALLENLLLPEDQQGIPMPQYYPMYLDGEGNLCLEYAQYEIAPYAAGMPVCCIPLSQLQEWLTDDARSIIGEAE